MRTLAEIRRFLGQEPLRALGMALGLIAGLAIFLTQVEQHYPIEEWLFWHYAGYWVCVLGFAASAWGLGSFLLDRVFRIRLPLLEYALIAFTLGHLAFCWVLFVLGAGHGYNRVTFFAVPCAIVLATWQWLAGFARRAARVLRRPAPRPSALRLVCIAFGFIGLLMVYFLVLTPENVQFDSRWKHMALAEDYVAHGGIRRSTEGWLFAARPHLISYLYSWAFLLPSTRLFDRMLLAAHLEYATFVVSTVLGVSVLVRRLVPKADPSMVWAARFLFPGVLLYDSSLSGGTDHFGAMYAAPLALVLFRALRDLEPRRVALLATLLAGPVLVKETAALLLVPFPVLAFSVRWLIELYRCVRSNARERLRALGKPLLVALGVGLAATSPLWLQNLVFYGDPLYPTLARFFPARPWSADAAYRFKWFYAERQMWAPPRTWEGLVETFKTIFTYSFVPNDWASLHHKVPVFGSLFTLLLLPLPFLKGTRRVWLMVAWVHFGILAWYLVHHQDRYLQGIVPLMAAAVAAILVLLVRAGGLLVRGSAALLVLAQVVWGGDVYFFQTHSMVKSPIKKVVDLLSAGFGKDYEGRFQVSPALAKMAPMLPKRARVLFHEMHPHLGAETEAVLDNYPWQYGIEYGAQGSPEGVRAMLRQLGITHVQYSPGRSNAVASLASDLLFQEFANSVGTDRVRAGSGHLITVPNEPYREPFGDKVAVLTCQHAPEPGLYPVKSLDRFEYGPDGDKFGPPLETAGDANQAKALLAKADYAVVELKCFRGRPPAELSQHFQQFVKRRRDPREIWRRSSENSEASDSPSEQDSSPEPADSPE